MKSNDLTIKNIISAYPDSKITRGSGKNGTTCATVIDHKLFQASFSAWKTSFHKKTGDFFMTELFPKSLSELKKALN